MHFAFKVAAAIAVLFSSVVCGNVVCAETTLSLADLDRDGVIAILEEKCGDCHFDGESFSVDTLLPATSLTDEYELWMNVRARLSDHSMPPADEVEFDPESRSCLTDWIRDATHDAIVAQGEKAGPANFRRLNRHEYSNTIRDLLEIHVNAGTALPQDIAGGEGFNNAAETLIISPIHAEKFLQAATESLEYAARDARARKRLFQVTPSESVSEDEAARQNLLRLANQAFRRPVDANEIDGYVTIFRDARDEGLKFDDACFYAMRGILVSADFLFLIESLPNADVDGTNDVALPDHELATRLSYFLWATMPDEELRNAADAGKLQDPEELRRQTLRMLTDKGTHLEDSLSQFVGQWLGTEDWGRKKRPDLAVNPWIEDHHVSPMRDQPVRIFEEMLRQNESLLELIDSDWTFLNQQLAEAYQFDRSTLPQKINRNFHHHLMRVPLTDEFRYRSGILGCGAVMGLTSYPRRTSPVLRGTWLLETFLGVELPPPPPEVPSLEDSGDPNREMTVREQLEIHRANAACASCHNRIDPIGFALENFDVIGRWRDQDAGQDIDAVATLPDGASIDGLPGLKRYLLDNKEQFVRHLTTKMLGYALARELRPSDLSTVESITERVIESDFKSQELILGIVTSKPFLYKRLTETAPE
ncbi:DUF1592 domain-containing protein [Rhodopirellula sp. MGV]|uniref:DUF1592 domain-containing protein n=1 Tax=Rhodopirellula sp. MGV TaxID=2023130 RepID=UPI0013046935|nr:DUF1592 domain-containing protein [Rhodopirellula sp. MGV]